MAITTLAITLPFDDVKMTATVDHKNNWVVQSDELESEFVMDWKKRFEEAGKTRPIERPVYHTSMSEEYAKRVVSAYEDTFEDIEITSDTSWDDLRVTDDEKAILLF